MDDRSASPNRSPSGDRQAADPPVRSRWSPKPEQIVILESIFNSGMVNPPKDETVRIRKLLEKFGAVGDANVFYWFQNRRSRSRRRQRQLQAAGLAPAAAAAVDPRSAALYHVVGGGGGGMQPSYYYEPTSSGSSSSSTSSSTNSSGGGCYYFNPCASSSASSPSAFVGEDGGAAADDLFSISQQMGLVEGGQMNAYYMCGSDVAQMNYQPAGTISVFINGIPSEVPRGPLDLRAMFGHNVMLVNSSGELLPVNEYGILLQSLQMGESYFLVSSSA